MMTGFNKKTGFTLIEIAIVLLIVSLLLGYTVSMYTVQNELKRYRTAEKELLEIRDSLIAFAQINGRLPCPDNNTDGQEDTIDNLDNLTGLAPPDGLPEDCASYSGMVPRATLGLSGSINNNGNIEDPWGETYWYHVSSIASLPNVVDMVSTNAIQNFGLANINPPELYVCADSDNIALEIDCTTVNTGAPVVRNVAAIILSTGKDQGDIASTVQAENLDFDLIYTKTTFIDSVGLEYDDVIQWISPNILYSKMIEAGQLP